MKVVGLCEKLEVIILVVAKTVVNLCTKDLNGVCFSKVSVKLKGYWL